MLLTACIYICMYVQVYVYIIYIYMYTYVYMYIIIIDVDTYLYGHEFAYQLLACAEAIGTGKVATPDQAEETQAAIRAYIKEAVSAEVADKVGWFLKSGVIFWWNLTTEIAVKALEHQILPVMDF